jgi:hypothetical protein
MPSSAEPKNRRSRPVDFIEFERTQGAGGIQCRFGTGVRSRIAAAAGYGLILRRGPNNNVNRAAGSANRNISRFRRASTMICCVCLNGPAFGKAMKSPSSLTDTLQFSCQFERTENQGVSTAGMHGCVI